MTFFPRATPLIVLLLANVLVAGWLGLQLREGSLEWAPPAAVEPARIGIPDIEIGIRPPIDEILARPLFWESRRPSAPPAQPEAPAEDPLADIKIIGVVGGTTEGGILFRDAEGRAATLRLGEALGGWRLSAVQGDIAVFRRGDAERSLRLPRPRIRNEALERQR